MKRKFTRITSGILAALILATTMTGCGKDKEVEDKKAVVLPPAEQVLIDKYVQNPEITAWMTYTSVTSTYIPNPENPKPKVGYWQLYENHTIQIDCMDLLVMGESTMGDVVEGVDKANKIIIANAVEAVRQQRQKVIDEEYAAAKAASEAKGKPYTKEKKEADISDIVDSYVNPYTYKLAYDNLDKDENAQFPYIFTTYEKDFLVDPSVSDTLYLFIYKYDVPYVQITCKKTEGKSTYGTNQIVRLYNTQIDQEKDWIITGVAPADCTFLVDQSQVPHPIPSYVDVDWNSKGSKDNIVTDGNIKFGGEGFTWDSLVTLCNALELSSQTQQAQSWRKKTTEVTNTEASTYLQTSDEQFTYHTLYLPINKFFKQASGDYAIPIAKLTATFDKKTNKCINWSIDYSASYHNFPKSTKHEAGAVYAVNVRAHNVDTNDYNGMLATVDNWVKEYAVDAEFGYFLVDSSGLTIGKLDNGLANFHGEFTVDGEKWYCTEVPRDETEMNGWYISDTKRTKVAKNAEEGTNLEELFKAESDRYYIVCMSAKRNEKGAYIPLAYYTNTSHMQTASTNDKNQYYIHYLEYDKYVGFKNAVVIDQDTVEQLFAMYARTFRFNTEDLDAMDVFYETFDTLKMRQYAVDYVEAKETLKVETNKEIESTITDLTADPTIIVKDFIGVLIDYQK